jgi:hypothetical protein
VARDKLQNFLELALRFSTIKEDKFKEKLTVSMSKYTHSDTLYALSLHSKVLNLKLLTKSQKQKNWPNYSP